MAKTYAWSNFPVSSDEHGQTTEVIKAGDPISQSDLGVSDEEWEYLLESGAVSEEEYPEDLPPTVSPAEYQAQKDAAVSQVSEARMTLQEFSSVVTPDEEDPEPKQQPATHAKTPPSKE